MKAIYITHCSRDKDEGVRSSGIAVTPDQLYSSPSLQEFIDFCRQKRLDWAIFSDLYGVVFPEEKINWYTKPPDSVTTEEFNLLVENFISRLVGYEKIYFYHRNGETHPLFKEIERLGRERGLPIIQLKEEIIKLKEE